MCGAVVAFGSVASKQCSQPTELNPLKKYEGSYYACDGNLKTIIGASVAGSKSLNLLASSEVYSGARRLSPVRL